MAKASNASTAPLIIATPDLRREQESWLSRLGKERGPVGCNLEGL